MAVLASWDTTALDNLTAATGTTEEDSVGSLWPLDGKLVEGIDLSTSLQDPGSGGFSEVEGTDFELRNIPHTDIISNSSHNHGNLISPVFHLFDEGLKGDGDFVGTAVVKSLQDHLVESRRNLGMQVLIELNQQPHVGVVSPHLSGNDRLGLWLFVTPIVTLMNIRWVCENNKITRGDGDGLHTMLVIPPARARNERSNARMRVGISCVLIEKAGICAVSRCCSPRCDRYYRNKTRTAGNCGAWSCQPFYQLCTTSSTKMSSVFGHITQAPPDPILGVSLAFKADTHPNKVDLGVGAYRTEDGKPYVLSCVKKACDFRDIK